MKINSRVSFALLSFLFMVCSVGTANAIDVSGTIVNGNWTKANSPYRVVGDVFVAGLTIQPGVEVRFQSNYVFEVGGVISAVGTKSEPIIFGGTNGWKGLYFNHSSPGSSLAYCIISNSVNSGIRITNSTPTIQYCRILNNTAPNYGAGIYVGLATNYFLKIVGCEVINNAVNSSFALGGGVFFSGSGVVEKCVIRSNICEGGAGTFNSAHEYGAGLYMQNGSLTVSNCIISANTANAFGCCNPIVGKGGGVYVASGSCSFWNCIIDYNRCFGSTAQGSGVYVHALATNVGFVNCSMVYNNREAIYSEDNEPKILNSIVYFNSNNGTQMIGITNATYSNIGNGFSGAGNINFNPVFLSSTNLIIQNGSPCIDAGNPDPGYNDLCFPPSLGSSRNDIGAHGGPGGCGWPAGWPTSILGGIADTNIMEQAVWQHSPTINGSGYTYSLANEPQGMTLDASTGTISWTPAEAQGPGTYSGITYVVSQNGSQVDSQTFTVTVTEVNTAPSLSVPGPQLAYATSTMVVTNHASDSDLPSNTLTFALVSSPAGVILNPSTGRLTWMPHMEQAPSTNTIVLRVYDNGFPSLSTTNSFTVEVKGPTPPTITNHPSHQIISSGQSASFTVGATGFPLPSYQWRFNGGNILGATNSSYTIPATTLSHVGHYDVGVTNSAGGQMSSIARLTFADLKFFAGLIVEGKAGDTYQIEAAAALNGPWMIRTNMQLPSATAIYIDFNSRSNSTQFYRAVPVP